MRQTRGDTPKLNLHPTWAWHGSDLVKQEDILEERFAAGSGRIVTLHRVSDAVSNNIPVKWPRQHLAASLTSGTGSAEEGVYSGRSTRYAVKHHMSVATTEVSFKGPGFSSVLRLPFA